MIYHRRHPLVRLLALLPRRFTSYRVLPVVYGHDREGYVIVTHQREIDRARYLPE
jgi:hypothetical protein